LPKKRHKVARLKFSVSIAVSDFAGKKHQKVARLKFSVSTAVSAFGGKKTP
jgi:hypothetical protein